MLLFRPCSRKKLELLYIIRKIKEDNLLRDFDVYMDSPPKLAEATNIFIKNGELL